MSDSIDRLYRAVLAAEAADPALSRTSRLMRAGRAKMAKKLGEEAIEVVIDAIAGNREAVVRESADLLYNLAVVWAAAGVEPREVWQEMDRRERMFGIAEKLRKAAAAKGKDLPKARRKVAPVRAPRAGKRGAAGLP